MSSVKIVCPECSRVTAVQLSQEDKEHICLHCQAELDDPFPLEVDDEICALHIRENDIPILVDFYSNYCAPCMAMVDDYEDAALGFPMKVRFLKIDGDAHQKIAQQYRVGALPTIIAFKNGKEVNRVSAQLSQVELRLWAEALLEL